MPPIPPPISNPNDFYALNLTSTVVTARMTRQQSPLDQIPSLTNNVRQAMGGFPDTTKVTLVLAVDIASHKDPMNFKWKSRAVSFTDRDHLSAGFQKAAEGLLHSFGNRGQANSDKPVRFGCIIDYIDQNPDGRRLPSRDGNMHDYVYISSSEIPTRLDQAVAYMTIAKRALGPDDLRALAKKGEGSSITMRR